MVTIGLEMSHHGSASMLFKHRDDENFSANVLRTHAQPSSLKYQFPPNLDPGRFLGPANANPFSGQNTFNSLIHHHRLGLTHQPRAAGDHAVKTEVNSQSEYGSDASKSFTMPRKPSGGMALDIEVSRKRMADPGCDEPMMQPTISGCILATASDAVLVVEACLSGTRSHAPRRPRDSERASIIRSGSVFVYESNASGIKRWTDGANWSPSRIQGNFLIYRELNQPLDGGDKRRLAKRRRTIAAPHPMNQGYTEEDKKWLGSLTDTYDFKQGGLIKRTIAITFNKTVHHVVCYYTLEDARAKVHRRPCEMDGLKDLTPRQGLWDESAWKIHPSLEEAGEVYNQQPQSGMIPPNHSTPYTMVPAATISQFAPPSSTAFTSHIGSLYPFPQHQLPPHSQLMQLPSQVGPRFAVQPPPHVASVNFGMSSNMEFGSSSDQYPTSTAVYNGSNSQYPDNPHAVYSSTNQYPDGAIAYYPHSEARNQMTIPEDLQHSSVGDPFQSRRDSFGTHGGPVHGFPQLTTYMGGAEQFPGIARRFDNQVDSPIYGTTYHASGLEMGHRSEGNIRMSGFYDHYGGGGSN